MILIGNGRVITNDENERIIENGCIVIEGNTIKEVGDTSLIKCKYEDNEHEYIYAPTTSLSRCPCCCSRCS